VIALHQRGISQRAIAIQLGMERKTVRHWLRARQFPERQITPRHSSVDCWLSHLEKRGAKVAAIAASFDTSFGPKELISLPSRCAAGFGSA
jgi:transposase